MVLAVVEVCGIVGGVLGPVGLGVWMRWWVVGGPWCRCMVGAKDLGLPALGKNVVGALGIDNDK